MEDPNSTLLPYILETLSRKPELCDTFDNLCREVQDQLVRERNNRYGNVKNCIQRALNVGQSLGIITLTNESIRVPFNFRQNKNSKAPNVQTSSESQKSPDRGNQSEQSKDKNGAAKKSLNPFGFAVRHTPDSDFSVPPGKARRTPMSMRSRARSRSAPRRRAYTRRGPTRPRGGRARGCGRRIYRSRR